MQRQRPPVRVRGGPTVQNAAHQVLVERLRVCAAANVRSEVSAHRGSVDPEHGVGRVDLGATASAKQRAAAPHHRAGLVTDQFACHAAVAARLRRPREWRRGQRQRALIAKRRRCADDVVGGDRTRGSTPPLELGKAASALASVSPLRVDPTDAFAARACSVGDRRHPRPQPAGHLLARVAVSSRRADAAELPAAAAIVAATATPAVRPLAIAAARARQRPPAAVREVGAKAVAALWPLMPRGSERIDQRVSSHRQ